MSLIKLRFLVVFLGLTVTVLEAVPVPTSKSDPTPKKKDDISEKDGGYDPPGVFSDIIDRRTPPGYQKMLDAKEKERRDNERVKMRGGSKAKGMQNNLDKSSRPLQPDLLSYNRLLSLIQKRIDMIHNFMRNFLDHVIKIKSRIPAAGKN